MEEFSKKIEFNHDFCQKRQISLLGKREKPEDDEVEEIFDFETEKPFEPELNLLPVSTNTGLSSILVYGDVKQEDEEHVLKHRTYQKTKEDLNDYSLEERNIIRMCQRFEKKADMHHIFQKWLPHETREKYYRELEQILTDQPSEYSDCQPHYYTFDKEITMFCNGKRDQRKITIYFDRFHSLNSDQKIQADEQLENLLSSSAKYLHEKYTKDSP